VAPYGEFGPAFDGERFVKIPISVIDSRAFWRDCLTHCLTDSEADISAEGFDTVDHWVRASEVDPSAIILLCAGGRYATDQAISRDVGAILQAQADARIVVVSDMDSPSTMVAALDKGARGFVTMGLSLEVTIEAIRIVKVGGTFVPGNALLSARQEYASAAETQQDNVEGRAHFTERQLAIIACVRKGEPNKIIAHKLNMTESTVKVHIRNIMRKIKAKNRTEVAFMTNDLTLPNELQ
jgi:DNA-binding NarL/FixJ family response regulator